MKLLTLIKVHSFKVQCAACDAACDAAAIVHWTVALGSAEMEVSLFLLQRQTR